MNTLTQIENGRQRISLNGTWQFKIDHNGFEQLDQVQEAFKTAQLAVTQESADLVGVMEEAGVVLDNSNPASGGNDNGHDQAGSSDYQPVELAGEDYMDSARGERESQVMLVSVPAPWQSQSLELCYAEGVGWYQRGFIIPPDMLDGVPENKRIFLGIDASDYLTEAWLNGVKVGENEGGYLPFEFDVSHAIQAGENVLTIRVDDSAELFCEAPHGKQGWYGPLSGIWQPVWLEIRSSQFLSQVLVFPEHESGHVKVELQLSNPACLDMGLQMNILGPGGEINSSTAVQLEEGVQALELDLLVIDHQAWSPATPNLYRLDLRLEDELGGEVDVISKIFGFRSIEARDGRLYLNGELLYLRGALDQDYYLDTIYTPPNAQLLEDQFEKAKELGFNLLRLHIKAPDPIYYDVADRMGMLVWTELPNWSVFSKTSSQRGRETLEGILKRDGHHPSIIIWTIINEDWGTDLVNEASHRRWLKETYKWLKLLDTSRLVVDNSPCTPNFHMQSDIDDYHFYRGIPDQRREWDEFIQQYASRPAFTYGPEQEVTRTGKEPLILSEFGNWGLPDADMLRDVKGSDPWWFDTGREWNGGVVHPQGVQGRFQRLGLGGVFGSWKAFIKATQEQQFNALKYELESIRRRSEISGYVITELTDVHWECNGLLDMRRNPKSYQAEFGRINAETVIVPAWERVAYWSGEPVQLRLAVAYGASKPFNGGKVHWRIKGHLWGSTEAPELAPGRVWEMGYLAFPAPTVERPEIQRVNFELVNLDGEQVATNYLDLVLYPREEIPDREKGSQEIPIYSTEDGLACRLRELGYWLVPGIQDAQLVITGKATGQAYSQEVLSFLEEGGRVLVLADRALEDGPVFPGILVASRKGTPWEGDWASSFSWLKRSGHFASLPGGPLVDQSFGAVIPRYVLTGFKEWEFPRMVQAGIVVGWVHKPAALIGARRFGKGKVLINSFHLPDETIGSDPTANVLMDALIATVGSQWP